MTIGDRLRERRMELHIPMTKLADAVGISKQTLYKYETGIVTNMPLDMIEKLSSALNVPPSFLMGWDAESDRYARISAYAKKMMELTGEHQRQIMELIDLYADKDGDANGKI